MIPKTNLETNFLIWNEAEFDMFYLFYFVVVGQVQTFWNQKNKKLKNNKNAKKKNNNKQTNKQTNKQN